MSDYVTLCRRWNVSHCLYGHGCALVKSPTGNFRCSVGCRCSLCKSKHVVRMLVLPRWSVYAEKKTNHIISCSVRSRLSHSGSLFLMMPPAASTLSGHERSALFTRKKHLISFFDSDGLQEDDKSSGVGEIWKMEGGRLAGSLLQGRRVQRFGNAPEIEILIPHRSVSIRSL